MTTADREILKLQLMRDEGIRLRLYKDTVGIETIGVGRNLRDKGISHDEAQFLLENDIDECVRDCMTFPWFADLDPVRQRVITNMRFNLGPSRLRQFKNTLGYVAKGEYLLAAEGMLASKWARQVGQRAIRLAEQMRTGKDS